MEPIVTSVAGTWTLTAINDKALPFILQARDPKLELIDRQYVFSATTFTLAYTIRSTELDGSTATSKATDSGTYTLANNVVSMQFQKDGTSATAAVAGNTMTFAAGVTQTYTKQ